PPPASTAADTLPLHDALPIYRRAFLGATAALGAAAAADMTGLNVLGTPALAGELKKGQKRVILLWLAGGSSQLETWDPKPGAITDRKSTRLNSSHQIISYAVF